jgi:hypothetical protein
MFRPDLVEAATAEKAVGMINDREIVLGLMLPSRFTVLDPGSTVVEGVRGAAPRHPRKYLRS